MIAPLWIAPNGHPINALGGLETVAAFGLLAEASTGYPALLAEMTLLTALRTAATSAIAARYLAPKGARTMTLIGNGAQAEFQALAMKEAVGIDSIASGRRDAQQITLFNSVGFAIEDFSALQYVREGLGKTSFCEMPDMIADPGRTRAIFGMLERARKACALTAASSSMLDSRNSLSSQHRSRSRAASRGLSQAR
jgi:hypothetical protein